MELRLRTVYVTFNRVALRWETDEEVPEGLTYTLWRSETLTGFEQVAETERQVHVDRVNLLSKNRNVQYQVRVTVNGLELRSNVADLFGPENDDAIRFQKRERFQLAKYDGTPALLYSRRTFGPRCPRCTAVKTAGDMGLNCTRCYGTGFDRGFYPPVPIYVAPHALDNTSSNLEREIIRESSPGQFWTSNWAEIGDGDVIIDQTTPNTIWIVGSVQATARFKHWVRQLFTAKEATRGGPLSNLPVPVFPWPRREEMWAIDHARPPRDFHTVFEELVEAYVQAQDDRRADEPAALRDGPQDPGGNRNPAARYSS